MSNYTMELRHICEHYAGLTPEEIMFAAPDEIISAARTHVFDFQYPLYDADHKEELETKILEHFYMREIGAETPGLWKLYLSRTMREIMPYFNQLYYSADQEYNPLHDVDLTRTHTGHASGISSNQTDRTGQTAGSGTLQSQEAGTSSNTRNETRAVDETVNTSDVTDSNGSSNKTSNTTTSTDTTGSSTGTKTSTAQYSDTSIERNAYSATPESTIQGVEGDGSGSGSNNVSDNYWLTDYRKISQSKSGTSSASENTTGSETGHSASTGTQTEGIMTTDHGTAAGSNVTDRDETGSVTDNGTTAGSRNETTSTTGSSNDHETGSANFQNADDWTETVTGKQGTQSYASMILEYRETILNIDMMIIEALEPCFMQIY